MLKRGNEILVGFGGNWKNVLNDIYKAEIAEKENAQVATWTKIETGMTLPKERGGMSASVQPKNQDIIIHGGINSPPKWRFDVQRDTEAWILTKENIWSQQDIKAGQRGNHKSEIVDDICFIIGGTDKDNDRTCTTIA